MKFFKNRVVAWLLTALTVAGCLGYGCLRRPADMPIPQRGVWIMDAADVLSQETEEAVLSYSAAWEANYNSVLAVATVDSTRGWDMYEYTRTLRDNWRLSDNDSVLVMDTGEGEYELDLGHTVYDKADSNAIYDALYDNFEPAFDRGNYDGAVTGLLADINDAYSTTQGGQSFEIDDYFENFGDVDYSYDYEYSGYTHSGDSYVDEAQGGISLVFIVAVIFAVLTLADKARFKSWMNRGKYSYAYRPIVFWHGGSWVKKMDRLYRGTTPGSRRSGPGPAYRAGNPPPGRRPDPGPAQRNNRSSRRY